MDLSKFSDSDLQALKAGDISKLSDQGLLHLKSQQSATVNPQQTDAVIQQKSNLQELGNDILGISQLMQHHLPNKDAISSGKAFLSSSLQGNTMGAISPDDLGATQDVADHPNAAALGRIGGAAGATYMGGKVLGAAGNSIKSGLGSLLRSGASAINAYKTVKNLPSTSLETLLKKGADALGDAPAASSATSAATSEPSVTELMGKEPSNFKQVLEEGPKVLPSKAATTSAAPAVLRTGKAVFDPFLKKTVSK